MDEERLFTEAQALDMAQKLFDSAALAQPELEALYGYCPECGAKGTKRERRIDGNDICVNGHLYFSRKAVYPAPPQREWQGLTDEEIAEMHHEIKVKGMGAYKTEDIYRAIEAKLRELNT